MGELDAKALVDILADKLSEIKAETLGYSLGHVDFGELLDTLFHTLAELQVEKPADTPYDVKSLCTDRRACLHAKRDKGKRHMPRHPERCGGQDVG